MNGRTFFTLFAFVMLIASVLAACVTPATSTTIPPTPAPDISKGTETPERVLVREWIAARTSVWEDRNKNGKWDGDESPLQGICVLIGNQKSYADRQAQPVCGQAEAGAIYTDQTGHGTPLLISEITYMSHDERDTEMAALCGSVHIHVFLPPGYEATTPMMVNDCEASFGLIKASTQ